MAYTLELERAIGEKHRLQAEIERLKNELKREQIEGEESDRQIQHLLSDNERLRTALKAGTDAAQTLLLLPADECNVPFDPVNAAEVKGRRKAARHILDALTDSGREMIAITDLYRAYKRRWQRGGFRCLVGWHTPCVEGRHVKCRRCYEWLRLRDGNHYQQKASSNE